MVRFVQRTAAIGCATALLAGCSSGGGGAAAASSGKLFAVSATSTAFFRYGPQQGNGADMALPKDTLLTVLRPAFGYYKVQLTTGEQGYVASEDVRVAPPTLLAALNPPPPPQTSPHRTPTGEQFRLDSNDPRLVAPPEDLPQAGDTPAP